MSVCSGGVLSRPAVVLKLAMLVEEVATGAQWGMLYRADATAAMEHVRRRWLLGDKRCVRSEEDCEVTVKCPKHEPSW